MTPNYGHRLIPNILRQEAQLNPNRPFALVANSEDVSDGFYEVTFGQITRAVDQVSHILKDHFKDKDPSSNPTLTYAGIQDLRYNIVFYASIQCRFQILLPSLRNQVSINASLMEQTESTWFAFTPEHAAMADELQIAIPELERLEIPSLADLLAADPKPFPYDLVFEQVEKERILVLHSSGSTGRPKPISMTHGTLSMMDDDRLLPTVPGRRNLGLACFNFETDRPLIYSPFPLFHLVGVLVRILHPLSARSVGIYGPPLRPPTGKLAADIFKRFDVRAAFMPPAVIEQLSELPEGNSLMKKLDILAFGGGPLSDATGDEVSKYAELHSMYGTTELGWARLLMPDRKHWNYLELHPQGHSAMEPVGDGLFELVLYSDGEHEMANKFLACNFPDIREWRTKDLFLPHPTEPNLWKFDSRIDDIIVFSNGEKLNPIPIEGLLSSVPGIDAAVVVGQGHDRAALLMELDADHSFSKDPLEELWPQIEKVNATAPAHGKVARSMVIIADSDKSFPRTGKGTVIRKKAEGLYSSEIKQLFEPKSARSNQVTIPLRASAFGLVAVRDFVRTVLSRALGGQEIDDDVNLFSLGLDSISTIETIGLLKSNLLPHRSEDELKWISAEILYDVPTVKQFSAVLSNFLNSGRVPRAKDRVTEMKRTIESYTRALPKTISGSPRSPMTKDITVALTGSTGFLGRHLLALLVEDPAFSKIYCLDRSSTAEETWEKHASKQNIRFNKEKLAFWKVNLVDPRLGLKDDQYSEISDSCDIIFHNAWRVDFNVPLHSFQDNLQSVKNLIDLSASSKRRPLIMFTSSISATGPMSPPGSEKQIVPEALVEDLDTSSPMGYGESKRVSEHVLNSAAIESGVDATVLRVGQIAASTDPDDLAWPLRDAIPIMYQTSKTLGLVPSDLEPVDWLPVNQMVGVIVDIIKRDLGSEPRRTARFYNLVNPEPTPWNDLVGTVQEWSGSSAKAVPMKKWVEELQSKEQLSLKEQESFPALKAMRFFTSLAESGPSHGYETANLRGSGSYGANLKSISPDMLKAWLKHI